MHDEPLSDGLADHVPLATCQLLCGQPPGSPGYAAQLVQRSLDELGFRVGFGGQTALLQPKAVAPGVAPSATRCCVPGGLAVAVTQTGRIIVPPWQNRPWLARQQR